MLLRAICILALTSSLVGAQQVRPLGIYLQTHYSGLDEREWNRVKGSVEVQDYQHFVSQFPHSRFAKKAQRWLDREAPEELSNGPLMKLVPASQHVVKAVPVDAVQP